jgi:hypothetical protein
LYFSETVMAKSEKVGRFFIFILIFTLVIVAIKSLFELFKRQEELTSDIGRKVLSNEQEKEKVFVAIKEGKSVVKTEYGELHIG